MTRPDGLAFRLLLPGDPASLGPVRRAPLPMRADTACLAAVARAGLHLLIPHPGETRSALVRCGPGEEPRTLAEIDVVPVAFAAYGEGFLVCGAEADGAPTTRWLDGNGEVGWRLEGPGVDHTRWPAPVRGTTPRVMWQEAPDALLVADVGPAGAGRGRSAPLGPAPVGLASADGEAWAVWRSGDDVRGVVLGEGESHPFEIRGAEADLVAVGARPGGATVLWNRGDDVWAAGVRRASPAGTATHVLSLAGRPARLDVVDAATPIVWARLFDALDDGPAAGDAGDGGSVVGAPRLGLLGVSGTLHEVLSWEHRVVLVGSTEIVWVEPLAAGVPRGG